MKSPNSVAWMLVCAALGTACANRRAARLQSDVRQFQREQSPATLTARGNAFAAVGDTTRAREYYDAALDVGGDPRELTPLLLSVCVRDGRYRLAIDYAERYLRKYPRDGRMRFVLGALRAGVGEPLAAEVELSRAVESNPANSEAEYALAVLLRDQRTDSLGADRHFRAYLALQPEGEHAEEARSSLLQAVP